MEAIQLSRIDKEWKLVIKRPEIDLQMIRMMNAFTGNRAGDAYRQNCLNVHRMFLDKFGKRQGLMGEERAYLQLRADEWTNLVETIFTRKLEAQVTGEDFNDMEAMTQLQKFLRKTSSALNLL